MPSSVPAALAPAAAAPAAAAPPAAAAADEALMSPPDSGSGSSGGPTAPPAAAGSVTNRLPGIARAMPATSSRWYSSSPASTSVGTPMRANCGVMSSPATAATSKALAIDTGSCVAKRDCQ